MSEDTTQNMQQNGSFEERVFARFDSLDARLQAFDVRMQVFDERLQVFDERLQALEIQAERRALETKPIWERALAEILEVKERLGTLEQLVRPMVRKVDILSRDMITLRAEQEGLEDRVEKLESKPV